MAEDFTPRDYQTEMMRIGLKKNTIIFLPTGSGKTYIALMILKQMCSDLLTPYSEGGKISAILVNTVALVEQHAKYIKDHLSFSVGQYSGDMNLDFWPKEKWYIEFNKYQIFVMTSQIFVNLVNNNFMDLNKVNLLIFDECHHGVNDHTMRQLMKKFANLVQPPRVLGLTATLLNGNCKPTKIMQEVQTLEVTYHSKVATVDGLDAVVGFSTNPTEDFKICLSHNYTYIEEVALTLLQKTRAVIDQVIPEPVTLNLKTLKPLEPVVGFKKVSNLVADLIDQIQTLGTYGGIKATLAHMIQIERIRRHCQDLNLHHLLSYVVTTFAFVKDLLTNAMKEVTERDQIYQFSSSKVLCLIEILKEYRSKSKEELCCIIFTDRRFTAKVVYHILDGLSKSDPEFSFLKPNFMVGNNNNPYNDTRELLYCSKRNKEVLQSFVSKEVNVLVASSVLEEGVDIPKCTLVVKFDQPKDYRSYIQSKGRARHKSSLYYIIIEQKNIDKFRERYEEFQLVEQTLNDYLIGKNITRQEPTKSEIEKMYYEDELPPYYVDGPGSAQVNMLSAIPLLCQYCASLPSDVYTMYTPEWYIEEKIQGNIDKLCRVVIMLPTVCPLVDIIVGDYMTTIKSAKRAAALKACIMLHKIGELDDHLLPRKNEIPEEDVTFLFTHYPEIKEQKAGTSRCRRLHERHVPSYIQGQILPSCPPFLHIIQLQPLFAQKRQDINDSTIYEMYASPLCFGILTPRAIPVLADFPIYVSLGTINVSLQVNVKQVALQEEDIEAIKKFHFLIFDDVLKILHQFLIFDSSEQAEMMLIVPIDRTTQAIDFDVVKNHMDVKSVMELTRDEKLNLEVTQETFLRKIVSPWYRRDTATYIVTEVSLNRSALSTFPNEDYGTFKDYFYDKHNLRILNPQQPLLLVKGLTKRLNFIKPKGKEAKRKRDKIYEEMSEHLLPELVVKQEFPAALWIQSNFLPTILYRVSYMLQLEELRCQIAKEAGLGQEVMVQNPLHLDEYLLDYVPNVEEELAESVVVITPAFEEAILDLPATLNNYNKDYAAKLLEAEYPWRDIDEPKDIERDLNVTAMDIEYYENFISQRVDMERLKKNESPRRGPHLLALTYHKDFVEKPIKLLENSLIPDGPDLAEMYRALTTAKANDIVNLERLETLGDSFLKMISSIYISLRFPSYDEGRATSLKSRLVSNKNLYYLAKKKNLSGSMKFKELSPREEWLPPAFKIPEELSKKINTKEVSVNSLFNVSIPIEEQISGRLSQSTINSILEDTEPPDENEDLSNMAVFLKCQYIGDKHVADVVESLLGAYFKRNGFTGGIKFVEWVGIIPKSENVLQLLRTPAPDPVIDKKASQEKIFFHIPCWQEIETILDYKFKNKAYLLQALTHSSYSQNRITHSYEKLEFLGDAILDFLITCHIYESCGNLNPGELTDLRSALVNNNTFASLVVRCTLHKFLLVMNSQLQGHIDKFVKYMEAKDYQIDDEVLILLEEDELIIGEYVDVPKILGDVFEALAGAIYLDSGKDLKLVWKVFYKIMWKEIDLFSKNVPKNVVRRLFESPGTYPIFGNKIPTSNNKCIISLQFMLNGRQKLVHGCGTNKVMAKKAAAKLALRFLEK